MTGTNLGGECFEATDLYPITGSIGDDTTSHYELRMKERGATAWIPFASGQGPSITGQLGVFDPTVLRNGIHDVQLYVVDPSGRITTTDSCAIVSGKLKVGQVSFAQLELALPAPGIPLTVGREYDSRAQGPGVTAITITANSLARTARARPQPMSTIRKSASSQQRLLPVPGQPRPNMLTITTTIESDVP